MKKLKVFLTILITVLIAGFVRYGQAETLDYSVQAIIPENQTKPGLSYFDLLLSPGQQQTLQVQLENVTNRQLKIDVGLSSAVTNNAGVVDYSPTKIKADPTLRYNI